MSNRRIRLAVFAVGACCVLMLSSFAHAQYAFQTFSKKELIEFTPEWKGQRFPDGRPRVRDEVLQQLKDVSAEEGAESGFVGGWKNLHPDRIIVGRAVTASFMPARSDMNRVIQRKGKEEGRIGGQNSWVIDTLVENDIVVVDLFGKIEQGTFAGDNLANAIYANCKQGMVINGAVRDLRGIMKIPKPFNAFIRDYHPSAIGGVMLMGINVPIRIGNVTVMPGDVVVGRPEGVIFIPPHRAAQIAEGAAVTRLKDMYQHQRVREKKYTPGQVDGAGAPGMEEDFRRWLKEHIDDDLPVSREKIEQFLKTGRW